MLIVVAVAGLLRTPTEAQRGGPGGASPAGTRDITVPFGRVINGDTLDTWITGHRAAIGMIGVTAPMGNTSCGQEATSQLKMLVKSAGGLKLHEDMPETIDAAGRRMYHVVDKQVGWLADWLVRRGLARANGRGKDRTGLAGAVPLETAPGGGLLSKLSVPVRAPELAARATDLGASFTDTMQSSSGVNRAPAVQSSPVPARLRGYGPPTR